MHSKPVLRDDEEFPGKLQFLLEIIATTETISLFIHEIRSKNFKYYYWSFLFFLIPLVCFSWGDGHRIVAEIAYQNLIKSEKGSQSSCYMAVEKISITIVILWMYDLAR